MIIPDDGVHRLAAKILKEIDHVNVTLAYQDFFAYQFVDNLNDIVRRAFNIRNLFAKGRPPKTVTRLCREAYQSYLYGFNTASVALIRSLIETALKDRLGIDTGELWRLNDLALDRRLYLKKIWYKIDQIREESNKFLHEASRGETPSEKKNLQLIGLAQEALQALIEQTEHSGI